MSGCGAALGGAACGADPAADAERIVLERELANLSLSRDMDFTGVLGEVDMLVVVHERTLAKLLGAVLPV